MPRRSNIHKILILGSGPIIIGQGCEFDYSGVQACRALKEVGYEIVLVNSNPATIMTDPEIADHTYIEPITWQSVAKIIEKERPDAILSTMGGQTALNCAIELEEHGILTKFKVELIGANFEAIKKAEDRELFKVAMEKIGLDMPVSATATDMESACNIQSKIGYPCIIRPSFTLGGTGGGVAHNAHEFNEICARGFSSSFNHQILIEESLLGWKEYELEVVRDANDSCIIVCTIENIDPMGVHTGDSITVAPAQTLTDVEYQKMRNGAIAVLREIGVQTGGSNVQFAVNPKNGRMIVIEMNPRVSRSSALASKATGFPIAKVAALLAVGYTLDELKNDITNGVIPASFEPTIDYVVVKIPRFNFDKFLSANKTLTTQMHSIGEVMAFGSDIKIALQKALCSLEIGIDGFESKLHPRSLAKENIEFELQNPSALRILYVADAFRFGYSVQDVNNLSGIDCWFLEHIKELVEFEKKLQGTALDELSAELLYESKNLGFSDSKLASLLNISEDMVYELRIQHNVLATFKRVDSCAAEFPANTAYLYSDYSGLCEAQPSKKRKVIVLGSGPNRIGQGIEFDYCCVRAVLALQEQGIEAIMINCNPETVSTDYDVSNRLYFEPLTLETVLEVIRLEQPEGVILQLGGQTPLKLAKKLQLHNIKIFGTSPNTIDLTEDRGKFSKVLNKLELLQPQNTVVFDVKTGLLAAETIGYPVIVRPSYVLGGTAMEIIYNAKDLERYFSDVFSMFPDNAVLIDSFLQDAVEVDVDIVSDSYGNTIVLGLMEHVEPAGVHSGDSASCMPPFSISNEMQQKIKHQACLLAKELNIIGLMNVQFAIKNKEIYILEANPRASRTIPFVAKASGVPVIKLAVAAMLDKKLHSDKSFIQTSKHFAVKQSVFPFNKFIGADPILGPEMRSTGEVMSFGKTFTDAYQKTMHAIYGVPTKNWANIFICVSGNNHDGLKELCVEAMALNMQVSVDKNTANYINLKRFPCKVLEERDTIISLITNGSIDFIVSTINFGPGLALAREIRTAAVKNVIGYSTTISGARAMLMAYKDDKIVAVNKLQDMHQMKVFEYESQ